MSELVFQHKHRHRNYIIDIKIYKVTKDEFHPEGFQYSLVLIKDGKRVLGYDNHERKGHHIHRGKIRLTYKFMDEWKLISDFQEEVERITEGEIK